MDKKLENKVAEQISYINELSKLEGTVKDNKVYFEVKDKKYRVRKPTERENQEIRKIRSKKFIELIKSDDYVLKEQLMELYKAKGIDIIAMENEIKELGLKIEDIQVNLNDTKDKIRIKDLKYQIKELEKERVKIATRISELLEPCVENELREFCDMYVVYLSLEKESEDSKWIKCFDSYDDFLNSDNEELVLKATANISLLIFK